MSTVSRHQQSRLTRSLKDLAFYESPQFRDNNVQAMEITRAFELHEQPEVDTVDALRFDETRIEIGLRAVRLTLDGGQTDYTFTVHCDASHFVHPRQLELPEADWYEIASLYEELDDESDDEDSGIDTDSLKEVLVDDRAVCEQYKRTDYKFDTGDGALRFSDESGYKIGGEYYGVAETHPVNFQYRSLPDIADLTEESTGEDILNQILFEEATSDLRDEFAETGDIMPYQEKLRELRFLVKCLRERQIKL